MNSATSSGYKAAQAEQELSSGLSFGWLKSVSQVLVAAAILGSILFAAKNLISSYGVGNSLLTTTFAASALLAVAYRITNPIGWKLVLSAFGYKTSTIQSARIWLLSESRRWLPGGVWGYASRAVQADKMGVPVSVASASMLVELLITMAAAVVVSLLGLLVHYQQLSGTLQQLIVEKTGGRMLTAIALAALAFITLGIVGYIARHKFLSKLRGLSDRFTALRSVKLTWTKLFVALAYMTVMAGLNGCVNQTLLPIVHDACSVPLLAMMAATATAWIVGFLAFFSPGGIFVREASLAALLLPWLPYEAGFTLAVLSRIAQLLAEVVCMMLVLYFERQKCL